MQLRVRPSAPQQSTFLWRRRALADELYRDLTVERSWPDPSRRRASRDDPWEPRRSGSTWRGTRPGRWRPWAIRSPTSDNEDRPGLPPRPMANCLATGPPGRGPAGGSHEAQARQEGDEVPGGPGYPEGSPESRVPGGPGDPDPAPDPGSASGRTGGGPPAGVAGCGDHDRDRGGREEVTLPHLGTAPLGPPGGVGLRSPVPRPPPDRDRPSSTPCPRSANDRRSGSHGAIAGRRRRRGDRGPIRGSWGSSPDVATLRGFGAPGGGRTRNLQIRSLALYPRDLRALLHETLFSCS